MKMTMDTQIDEFEFMKPEVKLISVTPDAEKHMAYCARVSNPDNQQNEKFSGLLKYCIQHQHWSIFEQASMTVEINTTRGIAAQILRHRSFTFQEFSQRYADTNLLNKTIPLPELRRQDTKNRQNSIDDIPDYLKLVLLEDVRVLFEHSQRVYNRLLEAGVAKECARFVLPLATPTRLYMTGSVRSWITYIALREKNGTQKEHMDIAKLCKQIFAEQFPTTAEALGGLELEWKI
jgi:thymidylate synthase (FAD)